MPFSGKEGTGTEIITKNKLYMDKNGSISIYFLDNRKKNMVKTCLLLIYYKSITYYLLMC